MIDTVKLIIKMDSPLPYRPGTNFQPRLDSIRPGYLGYFKAVSNPSAVLKKQKVYQPKLTYTQRPKSSFRASYELAIELSLPKLLYSNNFDELSDADLSKVVEQLRQTLKLMGVWLFSPQIENADVRAIHFCKNIVFRDYTSCSSVLKILQSADVTKTYDVQYTNFREGEILHIHSNSLDFAIYNKLSDLRQAKISEKRDVEDDNYIQLNLLDELARQRPLAILRCEARLNGKQKIQQAIAKAGFDNHLTFKTLYSAKLSKAVLQQHWQMFFGNIPKLAMDSNEPQSVLANILQTSGPKGPTQAAAHLGIAWLLSSDSSMRHIRNLFEDRFGKHAWKSIKPLVRQPSKVQYKAVLHVTKTLEEFTPTKLEDIKDEI